MKKPLAGLGLLLLVVFGLVFYFHRPAAPAPPGPEAPGASAQSGGNGTTPPPGAPNPASPPPAVAAPSAAPVNLAAAAGQVLPDTNPPPVLPPEIVLRNLDTAVRQFGRMFGGNPVGTNPEITAALTGQNPKGINFLRGVPGMVINGHGELVDGWGTPYFFHQISGSDTELHSAGPDRKMWTADDLVVK